MELFIYKIFDVINILINKLKRRGIEGVLSQISQFKLIK